MGRCRQGRMFWNGTVSITENLDILTLVQKTSRYWNLTTRYSSRCPLPPSIHVSPSDFSCSRTRRPPGDLIGRND